MPKEERSQPLENGSILEYIVHGEFAWKETDVNSTYGAWWMSLRTIVREVGAEAVEEKLEEFDEEVDRLRAQAIKEALEDSSEDEEDVRGAGVHLPGYPGIFISQDIPGYGGIVAML